MKRMNERGWRRVMALGWAVTLLGAGCAGLEKDEERLSYMWIVHDRERSDADRVIDIRRDPERLLEFYNVRPGMRVLDLSAGRGYNTELLARVVGPTGTVYAQHSPRSAANKAVKAAFEARLKKPVMSRVVYLVREFEDPVPPEVRKLDLVTFTFNYHDTVWMGVDRSKMNRAVFNALKPRGTYVIADHAARPGTGVSDVQSLHRIEEAVVRREVEAAGFKLVAEGEFLRNPKDPRDVPVSRSQVPNDEFVLKFMKP
jgi:predicted methyltransferase